MKNLNVLLVALLLVSCGSTKKTVKDETKGQSSLETSVERKDSIRVSEQETLRTSLSQMAHMDVEDSTEVWTVTTTSWYDTEKADSNGVAPLLKQETVRSVSFHGQRSKGTAGNAITSEKKSNIALTSQEKEERNVSAENVIKTSTRSTGSVSKARPVFYVTAGVVLAILMAILAYWVFSKYRAARNR